MNLLIKDNKNQFQYNHLLLMSFILVISLFFVLMQKYRYIHIAPKTQQIKKVEKKVVSIQIKPSPIIKKEQAIKVQKPKPVIKKIIKKPIITKPIVKKIIKKPIVKKPIIKKPMLKKVEFLAVKKQTPLPIPVKQKPIKTKKVEEKKEFVKPIKKLALAKKTPKVVFDAQKKASFVSGLYASLDENKYYPRMAKRRKLQGVVEVGFTLEKNGDIKNVFIHKSCGHKMLDKAAIKVVKSIEFYKKIPDEVSMTALHLKIPIKYKRS